MNREEAVQFVDALYDSWYSRLFAYATTLVPQRSSAEELAQEVFFDLYKALRAGQHIEYPKAWTMCLARRKASQRIDDVFGTEQPHEDLEDAEVYGEWARDVEIAIDCERVRARMNVLSPREYEVLTLRLEPMKYREIGAALGISTNSVNVLLARALEKLQKAMAKGEPAGCAERGVL